MKEIINIETISEVHQFLGIEKPKHPLISLIRLADANLDVDLDNQKYALGLYQISLKDSCPYTIINYGRNTYDYQEGTMVFTAPNQVLEFKKEGVNAEDKGWTLAFHPNLIRKSE